jgi:hypothetical protein
MFIFGAKHKDQILKKIKRPESKSSFKHVSIREDGSAYFDIKLIKQACKVNS